MIHSMKKDKCPIQEHTLYEYRLSENGTLECSSYDRYEILKKARYVEYRIPSKSHIRYVRANNLDMVKNNCITSLNNDPVAAIKAFYEYYHTRKKKAEHDIDVCNNILSLISKAQPTLTEDFHETD